MEEEAPCEPKSLSSCRNASDVLYYVRNKVELCLQNYMNLERTAKYLEKNHQISRTHTHLVWEILREQNPEFFNNFDLRCQMVLQMRMLNDLLTKQAVQVFENGLLDICDASASVRTLLRQKHPERVNLLETLASKRKLSSARPCENGTSVAQFQNPYDQQNHVLNPASFEMPYASSPLVAQSRNPYDHQDRVPDAASFAIPKPNSPLVVQSYNPYDQLDKVLNPASFAMPNPSGPSEAAQWQMPYQQLNQQHLYTSSLPMPYANGPSVTQWPIPDDQQEQPLYTTSLPLPYANGPSMTQLPIPCDQQNQPIYTTSLPLPYENGPSEMQMHIPYDQQDQHPYTTSLPLPTENSPSMTQLPIPNTQQNQDPISNSVGAPTFAPEDTVDLPLLNVSASTDPPKFDIGHNGSICLDVADALLQLDEQEQQQNLIGQQYQPHWQQQQQQNLQAEGINGLESGDIIDDYFCTFAMTIVDQQQEGVEQGQHPEPEALNNQDSGYIGHNGPRDSYINTAAQPSEQLQHQNGHYQLQQNVPVETLQREGRSNDDEFCNQKQSKRMCTSFDQRQAGKVKRHCPESEALTNPNTSNGTQTTGVKQQGSPKARATTRSLKEWEKHESEQ